MNILQKLRRIKMAFNSFNARFARYYLRKPWFKLSSVRKCQDAFYVALSKSIDYDKEVESMTTSQLSDELEMIMLCSTGFSRDDSIITEAVRRLRGPGAPVALGTTTDTDSPAGDAVQPTRRSEP